MITFYLSMLLGVLINLRQAQNSAQAILATRKRVVHRLASKNLLHCAIRGL